MSSAHSRRTGNPQTLHCSAVPRALGSAPGFTVLKTAPGEGAFKRHGAEEHLPRDGFRPQCPLGCRSRRPGTGRRGRARRAPAVPTGSRSPRPTPGGRHTAVPRLYLLLFDSSPPLLHIKIMRLPSMRPGNRTGKLIMTLKASVGHRDKALPSFHSSSGTPAPAPGLGGQVPVPRSGTQPGSPRCSGGSEPHHQARGQPGDLQGPVLCAGTFDRKSALGFLCRISRWSPTVAVTFRNDVLCTRGT